MKFGVEELGVSFDTLPRFSVAVLRSFTIEVAVSGTMVEVIVLPKLPLGFSVLPAAADTCVEETITDVVTGLDAVEFCAGPSVVVELVLGVNDVGDCGLFRAASDLLTGVFGSSNTEEDLIIAFFF